jgi:hypothetical protein
MAIAGPAASIANTIFSYFSPSKSPFYAVIAFGTVALLLASEQIESTLWWPVSIPIWLVLAVAWRLSFQDRPLFETGQHEEQLRFARSFSISSALLAIVLTGRTVDQYLPAFWGSYLACFLQVLIFLLYAWARSDTDEPGEGTNFVQFALITTTFLVGASFGLTKYVENLPAPGQDGTPTTVALQYLYTAIGLYVLWAACIFRWFKHLRTLITVDRPKAPI